MGNTILDVVVVNHRLDPIATELRIFVKVAEITADSEIRGRLVGPRCAYASTIEIAYPLREVARTGHFEMRVVIPEPSWWDPQTPFLYEGVVELWQNGNRYAKAPIRHGIRRLQLTPKGLQVNGKPFTLRGRLVDPRHGGEADANQARQDGINTVLVSIAEDPGVAFWDVADRIGFFVLGTSADPLRFSECRRDFADRPSGFGWIFNRAEFLAGPVHENERATYYGINTSAQGTPPNADFLCCHEHELGWLGDSELPKIVIVKRLPDPLPARPDVIGWIEAP